MDAPLRWVKDASSITILFAECYQYVASMLPGALSVCLRDFEIARGEKIILKQALGIGENFK